MVRRPPMTYEDGKGNACYAQVHSRIESLRPFPYMTSHRTQCEIVTFLWAQDAMVILCHVSYISEVQNHDKPKAADLDVHKDRPGKLGSTQELCLHIAHNEAATPQASKQIRRKPTQSLHRPAPQLQLHEQWKAWPILKCNTASRCSVDSR